MDKTDRHIKRLVNNPSFVEWAMGEADEMTATYWDEWVSKNPTNRQHARIAQQLIVDLEIQPADVSHDLKLIAWEQLDDRIMASERFSASPSNKLPSREKSNGWFYSMAAAAVLLIMFMSAAGYWRYFSIQEQAQAREVPMKTVSTEFRQQKTVELSDGSLITLNANSSISYYDGWVHEQKVKVKLSGEALFAVTERSSPRDPAFQVSTPDGNINVLGTRFAVSTREEATQVVLEEGTVEIERASDDKKNIQLKPDEMARFSGNKHVQVQQVNTEVYTSWAKHLFVFDQTPLTEVTQRIEHTFGIKVRIAEQTMKDRKLSGAVESTNLEVLTSALAKTLETSVTKEGDYIIIGKEVRQGARQ